RRGWQRGEGIESVGPAGLDPLRVGFLVGEGYRRAGDRQITRVFDCPANSAGLAKGAYGKKEERDVPGHSYGNTKRNYDQAQRGTGLPACPRALTRWTGLEACPTGAQYYRGDPNRRAYRWGLRKSPPRRAGSRCGRLRSHWMLRDGSRPARVRRRL